MSGLCASSGGCRVLAGIVVGIGLALSACGGDDGAEFAQITGTTSTISEPESTTSTVATTTTATTTTTTPPDTAPTSTTTSAVPPTTTAPATTATPSPPPLATAPDLVGSMSVMHDPNVDGGAFMITLTVTNVSDHAVALQDQGKVRYVAVRHHPVATLAVYSSYTWLGDADLEPGEQHTMSRTAAGSLAEADDTDFTAVIAYGDSFNRLVNTAEVLTGVPSVVLPSAAPSSSVAA
jgi:hypothetical protein